MILDTTPSLAGNGLHIQDGSWPSPKLSLPEWWQAWDARSSRSCRAL